MSKHLWNKLKYTMLFFAFFLQKHHDLLIWKDNDAAFSVVCHTVRDQIYRDSTRNGKIKPSTATNALQSYILHFLWFCYKQQFRTPVTLIKESWKVNIVLSLRGFYFYTLSTVCFFLIIFIFYTCVLFLDVFPRCYHDWKVFTRVVVGRSPLCPWSLEHCAFNKAFMLIKL